MKVSVVDISKIIFATMFTEKTYIEIRPFWSNRASNSYFKFLKVKTAFTNKKNTIKFLHVKRRYFINKFVMFQ